MPPVRAKDKGSDLVARVRKGARHRVDAARFGSSTVASHTLQWLCVEVCRAAWVGSRDF